MRKILLFFILCLTLNNMTYAQIKYEGRPMPDWIMGATPEPYNNTYYYKVFEGVHVFYHKDIFEAVYSTNLLMRKVEILITKPSELAFYPVVKVMMKHIGGHEVYGAVHAQEIGDSTFECPDKKSMNEMLDRLIEDKDLLIHLNKQIIKLKETGIYNGGYEVIKLAVKGQ